jgi:ribonuclease P protein component
LTLRAAGPAPDRRVRKRSEYLDIQARGRRVATAAFVLLLAPRPGSPEGPARLGIVASKKTGSAVQRNRAKRLIREAFRATPELWPAGLDLVVIVKRGLGEKKLADVIAEWRSVAHRIRRP